MIFEGIMTGNAGHSQDEVRVSQVHNIPINGNYMNICSYIRLVKAHKRRLKPFTDVYNSVHSNAHENGIVKAGRSGSCLI